MGKGLIMELQQNGAGQASTGGAGGDGRAYEEDKIVQIVKGDAHYTMHGISERGNLYAFVNGGWEFVCKSPKIEKSVS
jgi:hypothetical protein